MKNITNSLYGWPSYIIHILVVPFFLFDYVLLCRPFGMDSALDMGRGLYVFNLTMLCCIVLAVLALTRTAFHFLGKKISLNYLLYSFWCLGEDVIFSAFGAMYLSLMARGAMPFFDTLLLCLGCSISILIFPYTITCLSFVINAYAHGSMTAMDESTVIKFKDYRRQLKLAIASDSILYIEADNNYVIINYLNAGRLSNYTLRSSMKDIESLVTNHGIVRCQRTYFINPIHVKLLSRSPEGFIFAELDCDGAKRIPVSKTYYDRLSTML